MNWMSCKQKTSNEGIVSTTALLSKDKMLTHFCEENANGSVKWNIDDMEAQWIKAMK